MPTENLPLTAVLSVQERRDLMPVSLDLKAALAPGHLVKNDTPAIATVLEGTFKSTIVFKPEDLGKISGTLNEQLATTLFGDSYGKLTNDQKYLIVTLEAILENHNVDPSKIHPGDTFSFNFSSGTYRVDRGGDGQNVKAGDLKVADRIQNLEGVAPEKLAAEIDSLERGGLLVKALQQYKEDPSYDGRVAFIEAHKAIFVDLLNHYLPASSTDKFSVDAPHFGYKQTDNVTQNIAYLKAYLNLKRHEQLGTPLAIEVVAPAAPASEPERIAPPIPVSPEIVGVPAPEASPEGVPHPAETMPTMPGAPTLAPAGTPTVAPTAAPQETLDTTSRVDALHSAVDKLNSDLDHTYGGALFTKAGHERLRDLHTLADEYRKQYNDLLPKATNATSKAKLDDIDHKLDKAEGSVIRAFNEPKETPVAPEVPKELSVEEIQRLETLAPDRQVDALASAVKMLNDELLVTYGIEVITKKGREHLQNMRTLTVEMRRWYNELRPKATDAASIKKLRDIDQKLDKAEGSIIMFYRAPKEKVDAPAVAPVATSAPAENLDVNAAEHVRLNGEMTSLARRNAWKGVDEDFKKLSALPGEKPTYYETMLGAQASEQLGDIVTDKERLESAKEIAKDKEQVTSVLARLEKSYGSVTLNIPKDTELVATVPPFDPMERAAIAFAQKQIKETGHFAGFLPKGEYTYNGNKITVGEAPTPQQFAAVDVPVPTTPLATDFDHVSDESKVRAVPLMPGAPAPAADALPDGWTQEMLEAKKAGFALGIDSGLPMDEVSLRADTELYIVRSKDKPLDFAAQYDVPGKPEYLQVTYNNPSVDRDGRIKTTVEFKTATGEIITVPVETELPNRATIDAYLKAQNKAGRPLDFAKVAARIAWERYDEALKTALKTVKPTVDGGYAHWQSTLQAPAAEPTYRDDYVAPPAGPAPLGSGPIDFDLDDGYVAPAKTPEVLNGSQKVHLANGVKEGIFFNGDDSKLSAAEKAQIEAANAVLKAGQVYDGELPIGPYMTMNSGDPFDVSKTDGVYTYEVNQRP